MHDLCDRCHVHNPGGCAFKSFFSYVSVLIEREWWKCCDLTTTSLPVVYCRTYPTEGLAGTAETPSCCTGRGSTACFERTWLVGWPMRVTWRHAFQTRECWGAWHTLRKMSNIHRSAEKFTKWCVVSYVIAHWEVIFSIFAKFSDFTSVSIQKNWTK